MDEYETELPRYQREGFAPEPLFELHLDENNTLVLDGHAIEVFRGDIPSSDFDSRFHVRHVAVEMKPKRNGNQALKIGLRRNGGVWNLNECEVRPDQVDDVLHFFGEAKKRAGRPS